MTVIARLVFLGSCLLLLFCAACSAPPAASSAAQVPDDRGFDSLTTRLDSLYLRGHFNGYGVAIVDSSGVLYARGFGYADRDAQRPYTEQTLQNIASISKTFIGIALLKAQEMGALDLDDPVGEHLPFPIPHAHHPEVPITLRQLATHTAGITDGEYYERYAYVLQPGADTTNGQPLDYFNPAEDYTPMMAFLAATLSPDGKWYDPANFLTAAPGTTFNYSNVGATLAAAAIEEATGQDYADFVAEHILVPLGMEQSGFAYESIDRALHTTLYADPETPIAPYRLITYPDGGLRTSAADMGLYLAELIRGEAGAGTLLSAAAYAELFRGQLDSTHFPEGRDSVSLFNDEYNLGIFMGESAHGFIGHTGGDPGVLTFMFFHPATQTGRLVLLNTNLADQDGFDQFVAIWETLQAFPSGKVGDQPQ